MSIENSKVKKITKKQLKESLDVPIDENIQLEISDDSDFLEDLHKSNYTEKVEEQKQAEENIKLTKQSLKEQEKIRKEQDKENMKLFKEVERRNKEMEKAEKKNAKQIIDNDTASIFSEKGTPILGREKHILLKKVKQYKNLFPEELKKFKIKPNPSEQELQNYLSEMEILVELDSVDEFIMDGVIQSLKVVEAVSNTTKNYNISGLSDLLKANKQFHTLCKQLFIKYNCYSSMPPEYQMLFLISTSCYVVRNKNMNKQQFNQYLDERIK